MQVFLVHFTKTHGAKAKSGQIEIFKQFLAVKHLESIQDTWNPYLISSFGIVKQYNTFPNISMQAFFAHCPKRHWLGAKSRQNEIFKLFHAMGYLKSTQDTWNGYPISSFGILKQSNTFRQCSTNGFLAHCPKRHWLRAKSRQNEISQHFLLMKLLKSK